MIIFFYIRNIQVCGNYIDEKKITLQCTEKGHPKNQDHCQFRRWQLKTSHS